MKAVSLLSPLAALVVSHEQQIPLNPAEQNSQPLTLDAIPLLGFGTWNLKQPNTTETVSWAIQVGYRHIDCAAAYGNEEEVGKGLADGLEKTGLKREDLWITSKLWNDHHAPEAVQEGLELSLQKLGLDYLDLYHMHWPVASGAGDKNQIYYLKTWESMVKQFEAGKTHHIGKEWVEWHAKHNIHVTAYSPLAGTNPTYKEGDKPEPLLRSPVLHKIAKKRGCTPAQVALQWGMSRGTSVIPKSIHKEYMEGNFHASECVLKKKDFKKLAKLGEYFHRYNNPSKSWDVPLYEGLEDSDGKHKPATWFKRH
ncbi:hypothetical protein CERZMDRAFT_116742 [Cercospora zeae-maydis SCOH1-5]|uniref:NADP-dependent oxidoreductase domain-containing protein n=1 Tax=Cercospora zeae-maydis SCOH1-5 TaxID=717836 RepID=A0A6A6FPM2_9PEZI|nr:hypothetical protein CERZMDRAFT_116742 [Cercospora zeae-maydis SCOH1-5]